MKKRRKKKKKKRREGVRRKESGRSWKQIGKKRNTKKCKRVKNRFPPDFLVSYIKYKHIKYMSL